jgi:hypothetical protein
MFSFLTIFLVFYLAYNIARQHPDFSYFRRLLITLNICIVLYCFLQVILPNEYAVGGISEFALGRTRENRLTGPFNATAATADFLALMCVILLYAHLHARSAVMRTMLIALIGVNSMIVLMTGNRGGFILLVGGLTIFLWAFRKQLGGGRIMRIAFAGLACVTIASALVLNFSRFGIMYERLAGTQIERGIVPDTRRVSWEDAWAEILQSPVVGHGPRFRLGPMGETVAGRLQIDYPHSLPLYVLYTTGALGFVAYFVFFTAMGVRLARRAVHMSRSVNPVLAGLPRLSMIIFTLFMVSELRIEMLRAALVDYQHVIFMLFGTLLAFSDHTVRAEAALARASTGDEVDPGHAARAIGRQSPIPSPSSVRAG